MRTFLFFEPEPPSDGMVCLNVGSGGHSLPGFVDLDVPSPSFDHLRAQPFTPYDIRQDPMPFGDSPVDRHEPSDVALRRSRPVSATHSQD